MEAGTAQGRVAEELPRCTQRLWQRLDTESVYCHLLDQWVSFNCCQGCRKRPLQNDDKLERALGHKARTEP